MATTVQQTVVPVFCPTVDVVANAFVHQYYLILHQSPELVHHFYQDVSKLGRPELDGTMSITTTMRAIDEKILSLGYGRVMVEITTVDAQESYTGGVLVLVTGYLTANDHVKRKFTQTFFLAPQEKGYFVLNDVFRYVDDAKVLIENRGLENNREAALTPDQDLVQENHALEQTTAPVEGGSCEEVYNSPETGDGSAPEEEPPVPEVVDESPNESQVVIEPKSNAEELPKKSYASIVKFMKEASISASNGPSPLKSSAKSQEQKVTPVPPPPSASDTAVPTSNAVENGISSEGEAYGYSIYVKGLPFNAKPTLLENEFKKFGQIKSGGIQVRSQRGFCFGFVEFEEESAMKSAIEASPMMIGERQVIIEQKKSTNRGNDRGKFSSGRGGGFRNEGARGRGSYGGSRGYGRGDFDPKNNFGNRASGRVGSSNRGGDQYNKSDKMGGNASRLRRGSGMAINTAAETTAQRIPVQA